MKTYEDNDDIDPTLVEPEAVSRLTKDMKTAVLKLRPEEVRFIVDHYYQMQDNRIRSSGQIRSLENTEEPHEVLTWLETNSRFMENQVKAALNHYSENHPIGKWMLSLTGVGPVISAGLLAHVDMQPWKCCVPNLKKNCSEYQVTKGLPKAIKAMEERLKDPDCNPLVKPPKPGAKPVKKKMNKVKPWAEHTAAEKEEVRQKALAKVKTDKKYLVTHKDCCRVDITSVGHIWSFAGLNPTRKWEKNTKRPWNAFLKTLCTYKLGESFVKFCNHKKDHYGRHYVERKQEYWEANLAGRYQEAAAEKLRTQKFDDNYSRHWYEGKFSPATVREYLADPEKSMLSMPFAQNGDGVPMLPPAHIHARARRFAVKMFLSHLFEVWFEHVHKKKAPECYPIAHLGHVDKVKIPNYKSPYA